MKKPKLTSSTASIDNCLAGPDKIAGTDNTHLMLVSFTFILFLLMVFNINPRKYLIAWVSILIANISFLPVLSINILILIYQTNNNKACNEMWTYVLKKTFKTGVTRKIRQRDMLIVTLLLFGTSSLELLFTIKKQNKTLHVTLEKHWH